MTTPPQQPPAVWSWGPEHTPALARAVLGHPATAHLPPHAATDLIHTAGHDLRRRTAGGIVPDTALVQILWEIAHGPYQYLNRHSTGRAAPSDRPEMPYPADGPGRPRNGGRDGPGAVT